VLLLLLLHRSVSQLIPISPVACITSATSPDKPGALFLIFFSAAMTSGIVIQSAGPSSTSTIITNQA